MSDDHGGCKWVNVSSDTGWRRLSRTKSREPLKLVCMCVFIREAYTHLTFSSFTIGFLMVLLLLLELFLLTQIVNVCCSSQSALECWLFMISCVHWSVCLHVCWWLSLQQRSCKSKNAVDSGPKRLHISNIPFRFREPDLRKLLEVRPMSLMFFAALYSSVF